METNNMQPLCAAGRQRGFTLVELLVAISILAIVAVLGWRGLDGILRGRAALTADLERTRGMQLTFAQMQSDCLQLASGALLGVRAPLLIQQNRLVMVRTVSADRQPVRIQAVEYRLRDGILTRSESPQTRDLAEFDRLWQAILSDAGSDAQERQAVVLQSHIRGMQMRLWNGAQPGWSDGPEAQWPTDGSRKWSGLEVSLLAETAPRSAPDILPGSVVKVFLLGSV